MKNIQMPTTARMGRAARQTILATLLASTVLSAGCFGRFPLTREVYKFNRDSSENEFVQTIVFWVFCLLPYPGAALVDAFVLNAIEFWSGNIVNVSDAGGRAVAKKVEQTADGGVMITVALPQGGEEMLAIKPIAENEYAMTNAAGRTTAIIRRGPGGEAIFCTPDGMAVRTMPAMPAGAAAGI